MVRERAVEVEVEPVQVHRAAGQDGGDGEAGHPVAGVHHDRQRADAVQGDQRADEGDVARQQVRLRHHPGRRRRRGVGVGGECLRDLRQPRVPAHRHRTGAAQLDAVVLAGVVTRRDHRPGSVQHTGGVVEQVGGGQPDVGDVDAGGGDAVGEGGRQQRRGHPGVAPHHDARMSSVVVGPGEGGEGGPGAPDQVGGQLLGDQATDVIGLDDVHAGRI